jgi:chitin disaccharide deacetylase
MSEAKSQFDPGAKYLIINADDFGASPGVNRGIVESHQKGVLTSTSMMVTGNAVADAIELSRQNPELAIGLHFDVLGEDERVMDTRNVEAMRVEFFRQLEEFHRVMERAPTHIDSHRHVHRQKQLFESFCEWTRPMNLPVRSAGEVVFKGGFYGQWVWKVTDLQHVSVEHLQRMIRDEVPVGFTEISTHPGFVGADYQAVYNIEREEEVRTLTDPRIRETIAEEGIALISYADYNRLRNKGDKLRP